MSNTILSERKVAKRQYDITNTNPKLMRTISILISSVLVLLSGKYGHTQPNTISLADGEQSPQASIEMISWLAGHWQGEAFGGIVEEIWTPPLGGTMMCAFKLVVDGKVSFYEIETITEENESLMLRLKHFHGNLKGWEEKNETVDFPLVKVTSKKIFFDGFTIEYVNDDQINMYVMIGNEDEPEEVKFEYKKMNKLDKN